MIFLHTNLFLRFLRILTVHEEGPVSEKLVRTLFDYHTSICNNWVKQKTQLLHYMHFTEMADTLNKTHETESF